MTQTLVVFISFVVL